MQKAFYEMISDKRFSDGVSSVRREICMYNTTGAGAWYHRYYEYCTVFAKFKVFDIHIAQLTTLSGSSPGDDTTPSELTDG